MSSEMFMFENSFFSDPFSPFTDTHPIPLEMLQEEVSSFDEMATGLLSSSPPSVLLENLSISQLGNTEYSALEVKTEEASFSLDGFSGYGDSVFAQSYDGAHDSAMKYMHRSFSSNCFENKQGFSFRPQLGSLLESDQNLQGPILSSPESSFSSGQMRRVCSAGDLQNMKPNMQTRNVLSSSPLSGEKLFMEESNFKVGRYSAEERKEKIDRYRAKRTQRNFNKTIKYACRKTLADTRPRIRGRFARNDEAGEIPKASMFNRYEDEDDLCIVHGFYEQDHGEGVARFNSFGSTHQYPNYSY